MRSVSGFTLIEVVIGIVLIVAVSLAALEFYVHSERFIIQSKLRLMAMNFARERMEALYWLSYDGLNTPPPLGDLPSGGDLGLLRDRYSGSRTDSITTSANGYKVITVRVEWTR